MAAKNYPIWHYAAAGVILLISGIGNLWVDAKPLAAVYLVLAGAALGVAVFKARRVADAR